MRCADVDGVRCADVDGVRCRDAIHVISSHSVFTFVLVP